MGSRRSVLLAAIIFTAACYKVTAQDTKLLDALNTADVVDDQYNGCRDEAMKEFIQSDLLKQELSRNEGFQKAWNRSHECLRQIPGGKKEHTAALSIYAHGDHDFLQTLNKAIETMGGNVSMYENHFHFKSLHFLLMDSMKLLKPKECKTFYVFKDGQSKPQKGSTVRFTSFTSAYSSFEEIKSDSDLYGVVVLNLTSCFFVNLKDHVCGQNQDAILLSPAEVFTVEGVETKTVDYDDNEKYVEIVLKQSGLKSSHNCYISSRNSGEHETVTAVTERDRVPGGQQTVTAVTERDRVPGGQQTVTAVTERDSSPPAVVSTLWLVSVLVASFFFNLAL